MWLQLSLKWKPHKNSSNNFTTQRWGEAVGGILVISIFIRKNELYGTTDTSSWFGCDGCESIGDYIKRIRLLFRNIIFLDKRIVHPFRMIVGREANVAEGLLTELLQLQIVHGIFAQRLVHVVQ